MRKLGQLNGLECGRQQALLTVHMRVVDGRGSLPALPRLNISSSLLFGFRLGPDGNPLDGSGKELRLVELYGLGPNLSFVVVVPGLGLDVHPVALLQLRRVFSEIAEDDDVLPVGAGLPVSCVVGPVRGHGDGEGYGSGAVGLFDVGHQGGP